MKMVRFKILTYSLNLVGIENEMQQARTRVTRTTLRGGTIHAQYTQ